MADADADTASVADSDSSNGGRFARWTPAAHVVTRDVGGGGAILVNVESGACWELSRTAAALWKLLADGVALPAAIESVVQSVGGGDARVRADMRAFAEKLRALEILIEDDAPAATDSTEA